MTKKLKRKLKRITASLVTAVAGICTIAILSADVFVMPINNEESKLTSMSEAKLIETIDGVTETSEGIQAMAETTNASVATYAEGDTIECKSIVQGARDNDIPNGNYKFRVRGQNSAGGTEILDYPVEIINYYDDVHYSLDAGQTSKVVSLGDSTTTYKMLIVKYHKNLIIDAGVTVTATNVSNLTYKKGMYLCVMGELKNQGTISMTARGTYNQAGENVFLWKNTDNTYEYVPAIGGAGGARVRRIWLWYKWYSSEEVEEIEQQVEEALEEHMVEIVQYIVEQEPLEHHIQEDLVVEEPAEEIQMEVHQQDLQMVAEEEMELHTKQVHITKQVAAELVIQEEAELDMEVMVVAEQMEEMEQADY